MRVRLSVLVLVAGGLALCACTHTPPPAPAVASQTCADFTIPIYFEAGSASVTVEGAELIHAAAGRLRPCDVLGVDVVGLADAAGDPQANLALSRRRADAVTAALVKRGFPIAKIQVAAAGEAGAETAGGQARPLRRRADVTFHAKAR